MSAEVSEAEHRAMAQALFELSVAKKRHAYTTNDPAPRKADLLRSGYYLRLRHPEVMPTVTAAAADAGISPGTAASWFSRDRTLGREWEVIQTPDRPVTEEQFFDRLSPEGMDILVRNLKPFAQQWEA